MAQQHVYPPPPVSKKAGSGSSVPALPQVIWKPAYFLEDNRQVPNHLLGSSGPADHSVDDSLVELEASQNELEALDNDTVSDKSMETSHEMSQLKKQLQLRKKQVQKAQKTAKIEQLHSKIVKTDQQLACLRQQSKSTKSNVKEGSQPVVSSTA